MPRKRGIKQNFTFNKGWNTEASPMTFPENTAQDLDNVVLDIDGSVRRRAGIDYDEQANYFAADSTAANYSTYGISFHKWENVAGAGSLAFTVAQYGTTLYFHTLSGTDTGDNFLGSVDFSSLATDSDLAKKAIVSTASGLGYLFVVGENIEPFYVEYDVATGTLTLTEIIIEVRDFEGIDEAVDVDNRPTSLTLDHRYNLLNQGWLSSFPCINDSSTKSTSNTIDFTFTELGVYPSNADVLYYGKTSSGADESEIDRYNPTVMVKNVFGTTPAPRGHYIFNAFNLNRSSVVAGVTDVSVSRRPKAVAFHNGRAFYSGVFSTGYSGNVYYSQQLTDIKRAGNCYQENDPTSEIFNDLLATDGGVLTIPGAGNIVRLIEASAGVVVFAENGVWEITGQEGKFSATEFFVKKVTSIGCRSPETVVFADGILYYWSDSGIIALRPDSVSGSLNAENISKSTIQTGYLLFGGLQRNWARGRYIEQEKKIVWLYSTNTDYNGVTNRFKYNGLLILDLQLGAFYKYSVSDVTANAAPYLAGILETPVSLISLGDVAVTAGGVDVTAGGETVTVKGATPTGNVSFNGWILLAVRPLSASRVGLTFTSFTYNGFLDWFTENGTGVDYSSYLETGYDFSGEVLFEKRPTYVYTYMSKDSKSLTSGNYFALPEAPTYYDYCLDLCNGNFSDNPQFIDANVDLGLSSTYSIDFNPTGTICYVNEYDLASGRLNELALSTPWDVSTATVTTTVDQNTINPSWANDDIVCNRIHPNDGSQLFYISGDQRLVTLDLSTPYALSTYSINDSFDLTTLYSPGVGSWNAFEWLKSDGTEFVAVHGNDKILHCVLTTPWDVSTASLENIVDTSAYVTANQTVDVRVDYQYGTKLMAWTTDKTLLTYEMTTPFDFTSLTLVCVEDAVIHGTYESTIHRGIYFTPDGTTMIHTTAAASPSTYQDYLVTLNITGCD